MFSRLCKHHFKGGCEKLIYTSDFRGRFRNKLVPFTKYNYFYIEENVLA
jgi:hypothetical protein